MTGTATLTTSTNGSRAAEAARVRTFTAACETLRAAGRGELVDAAALAAAEAVVAQAAAPPSLGEQHHADAMFALVAEANRMHQIAFPRR